MSSYSPPPPNFGPIIPLDGGSHVHRHNNSSFHLTDNLSSGYKNYYSVDSNGNVDGPRDPYDQAQARKNR